LLVAGWSPPIRRSPYARQARNPSEEAATIAKKQTRAELDKSGIPLAKLIEGLALDDRTTNTSPRTVAWYTARLGLFRRFASDGATLRDISVAFGRAFIGDLQTRTCNPNNPFFKRTRTSRDPAPASIALPGL
jgi:hypothetical protein